ncbi:MAG: hypothetical protein ACK5SM_06370 [Sphingomonadales bacterium]
MDGQKKTRFLGHRDALRVRTWMAENVGVYSGPTAGAKAATEALGFAVSPSSIDYWRLDFPGWAKEQPVLITPEALADQMERLYNQMIDLAKLVKENAIAATERFQNVEAEVAKHEQRLAEFARDVLTEDLTPVVWTGAENAPKGS